jgi:hypothetical protein
MNAFPWLATRGERVTACSSTRQTAEVQLSSGAKITFDLGDASCCEVFEVEVKNAGRMGRPLVRLELIPMPDTADDDYGYYTAEWKLHLVMAYGDPIEIYAVNRHNGYYSHSLMVTWGDKRICLPEGYEVG